MIRAEGSIEESSLSVIPRFQEILPELERS